MISTIGNTVLDLHIHSKFSRACSKDLLLPNIAAAAARKGITLMGTGDFTHPGWFAMMEQELTQTSSGFYECKAAKTVRPVQFVPTVEIACIYKKNEKVRRLHVLVVAPDLSVVRKINIALAAIGNLKADGRPMLGLDAKRLLEIVLSISEACMFIPAHVWTPWFSVFGSKSGFDSLEECFEELTPYVTAIETGLSSDPQMNWQISHLDKVTLLSNSDAHSLDNLGREATVLTGMDWTYDALRHALSNTQSNKIVGTIEFYPEEGKYHVDGHAMCGVRLLPDETRQLQGVCPKCGRSVTVGVLSRASQLADRMVTERPSSRPDYVSIVPLREILSEVIGVGKHSKAVARIYEQLVPTVGTEFEVLIDAPLARIQAATSPAVADAVNRVRRGAVTITPGYDGIFGSISLYGLEGPPGPAEKTIFG
ncbi:MAG: endonuclease Q family protein [Patescibacteria group bacterium]